MSATWFFGSSSSGTRLLAYGDSFTAGYHYSGAANWPWAQVISARLGADVHVVGLHLPLAHLAAGLNERSLLDYLELRGPGLLRRLATPGPSEAGRAPPPPFAVVLIMAGTDDVGSERYEADATLAALLQLHAAAAAAPPGMRTIGITVPVAPFAAPTWAERARVLNAGLRAHYSTLPRRPRAGLLVEAAGGADGGGFALAAELWEADGLHLTRAGYEVFGGRVADAIAAWMMPSLGDGKDTA